MLLKFKASTIPAYKGVDGNGGLVSLQKDDVAEIEDNVAKILLQKYGRDFDVVVQEAKPEHMPKADKMYKKTGSFKSK